MPRVKKMWKNKSYKVQDFIGVYYFDSLGQRFFKLSNGYFTVDNAKTILFDSPQAAKKAGWVQCK